MLSPSPTIRSTESKSFSRQDQKGSYIRNEIGQTTNDSKHSRGIQHHQLSPSRQQQQHQPQPQQQQLGAYLNANRSRKPATSSIQSWLSEPVREQPWTHLRDHRQKYPSQSPPEQDKLSRELDLLSSSSTPSYAGNISLSLEASPEHSSTFSPWSKSPSTSSPRSLKSMSSMVTERGSLNEEEKRPSSRLSTA